MINIADNTARFKELVNSITRPGFRKEEFLKMIDNSDFLTAPASTKFHNDFEGGLCDHCLKVYDNLVALCDMKKYIPNDPESIIIVALFHDLGKINQYVKEPRNVKKYCKTKEEYDANPKAYNKKDELGTFGWFTELSYSTSPNRLIFGNHESTCEYVARSYIPLRMEESIAILHHMGSLGFDSAKDDFPTICRKYPLACLLFEADFMASMLDEEII